MVGLTVRHGAGRPAARLAGGAVAWCWFAACSGAAVAQDAWPAASPEWTSRDAAGGIAWLPLLAWWVWIACWAASSDWVYRDSTRHKVRPPFWAMLTVFPFAVASLLAWWIPWAAAGQSLMVLAWIVPLFFYARERNPKAPPAESILTVAHARRLAAAAMSAAGVKVKTAPVLDNGLPWVTLVATCGETPEDNAARQEEVKKMPGFAAAKTLLQEAIAARATRVVIEAAADGVRVAQDVDGIMAPARGVTATAKGRGKSKEPETWGDAAALDPTAGAAVFAALKTIAGADLAKLAGEAECGFLLEVDGKKRPCKMATRSTKTAKQIVLTFDTPPLTPKKLEDLGMTSAVATRVKELIALENGLFVVSSPPASGCSTTFDAVLNAADRLLRDFVSIEDSGAPPHEVQNVKPVRYSAAAGDKPVAALKTAMLEYPRAVVTRDLTDKEMAAELLKLAEGQLLVIVSVQASDALDAIQKLLDMGVPAEQLARCLLGSLSQRLIRKLCPACGDPQPPSPELLQRLKMTAEELPEVKRASPYGGCRTCAGRQFIGRTALFELAAGPTVRQALAKQVDPKTLRQAAVKDGMRTLTDEGRTLVAAGTTSYEEMTRVFAPKKEAAAPGARKK